MSEDRAKEIKEIQDNFEKGDLGIKVEPKEVAYWMKVKEQAEEAVYQSYKEIKINGRIACLAIEEIKKEKDLSKSVDK